MKNTLFIFGFTVLVTLFYWYVGQQVPQKETYPPETKEISADLTTEEMVEIGREIVAGKGTCLGCHTIGGSKGGRFPDLGNIGAVAGSRRPGMSDVEYLAQSIYDPNAYIVEGYLPGMPPISKPPISLTDEEILTVIAYLQSLGGKPTVTMHTVHAFTGTHPAAAGGGVSAAATAPAAVQPANLDGPALMKKYLCTTCHNIDSPAPLVGPSLYDVGKRLSKGEIYEAIIDPNATIAKGYAPGIMSATIGPLGFPDKVSAKDVKTIVDYLASLKGNK